MHSPGHADAFINRGKCPPGTVKRLDEALLSFDRAIALKPGHADAFNNPREMCSWTCSSWRKRSQATIEPSPLKPNEGRRILQQSRRGGNALKDLNRLDEALASYGLLAVALNPRHADACLQ